MIAIYITSLYNASGVLPPYKSTLLPDNDKSVKREHGGGRLPVTFGVIHFPKDKDSNTDYHRYN